MFTQLLFSFKRDRIPNAVSVNILPNYKNYKGLYKSCNKKKSLCVHFLKD